VWVQPSEAATLQVHVASGAEQASAAVGIPLARIAPLVFLPGLGATNPPSFDVDPNTSCFWANKGAKYGHLFEALERLGYEKDHT
jgi:hypothetical protein